MSYLQKINHASVKLNKHVVLRTVTATTSEMNDQENAGVANSVTNNDRAIESSNSNLNLQSPSLPMPLPSNVTPTEGEEANTSSALSQANGADSNANERESSISSPDNE